MAAPELPNDVLREIAKRVDPQTLQNMAVASSGLNQVARSSAFHDAAYNDRVAVFLGACRALLECRNKASITIRFPTMTYVLTNWEAVNKGAPCERVSLYNSPAVAAFDMKIGLAICRMRGIGNPLAIKGSSTLMRVFKLALEMQKMEHDAVFYPADYASYNPITVSFKEQLGMGQVGSAVAYIQMDKTYRCARRPLEYNPNAVYDARCWTIKEDMGPTTEKRKMFFNSGLLANFADAVMAITVFKEVLFSQDLAKIIDAEADDATTFKI